jgi:predicted transcriptional regulator
MKNKFLKQDIQEKLLKWKNPVDWFNRNGDFVAIFSEIIDKNGQKVYEILDSKNVRGRILEADQKKPSQTLLDDNTVKFIYYDKGVAPGSILSLFETLTVVKFNGNYKAALNYVEFRIMKTEVPFIRVGNDYFKLIYKKNRYEVDVKTLKHFKKETITDDYGKGLLDEIPKFDDFTIIPNNINYSEFYNTFYNLYSEFPHRPQIETSTKNDFPHIDLLLNHIFGDQVELGYKYMKVMYEHPQKILPVLVLASTERQTGKTTFLNLLEILFADNYVQIAPDELQSNFNSIFATKNIVAIDETVMEKQSSVEKIKAIATQKSISVNQKYVSQYKVPFFGKIVIGTNREKDFMRIDEEEIRFWVRRVPPITQRITDIEERMTKEIPAFLRYILDLQQLDFSKSRMVFTEEEIRTETLDKVVAESKSSLYKEICELFTDYFCNDEKQTEIKMAAIDIKKHWFLNNNQISSNYISKVIKDEFKKQPEKLQRYTPLGMVEGKDKIGTPFVFYKNEFVTEQQNGEIVKNNDNDVDLPF